MKNKSEDRVYISTGDELSSSDILKQGGRGQGETCCFFGRKRYKLNKHLTMEASHFFAPVENVQANKLLTKCPC